MFYRIFPYVFLLFMLWSCSKSLEEQKSRTVLNIEERLKQYDRAAATSADRKQADSIGKIILSLNNSAINRELLMNYISKVHPDQTYVDSLFSWSIKANDRLSLGLAFFVQGKHFHRSYNFENAFYNYLKAEHILDKLGDSLALSDVHINKAVVLSNQGAYSRAAEEAFKGISYGQNQKNARHFAFENFTLGTIYVGLEQLDKAKSTFQKAIYHLESQEYSQLSNPITKKKEILLIDINLAKILNLEQKYEEALDLIHHSLRKISTINSPYDKMLQALLMEQELVAMLALGHIDGIDQQLREIIAVFKDQKLLGKVYETKVLLADFYFKTNQSQKGFLLLNEVLDYLKEYPDIDLERRVLGDHLKHSSLNNKEIYQRYQEVVEKSLANKWELKVNHFDLSSRIDRINRENDILISQKAKLLGGSVGGVLLLVILLLVVLFYFKRNEVNMVKLFQKETELYYESLLTIHKKLSEVQFSERKNIARDLHDGVLNGLFVVRFGLYELYEGRNEELKLQLIKELMQVESFIRNSSHTLLDSSVGEVGFKELLKNLVAVQNRSKLTVFLSNISEEVNEDAICSEMKINIYQILQEALQNVQKHALAMKCLVELQPENEGYMRLTITDDGIGFDSEKVARGIGLTSIEERAAKIKAKYALESSEKGTKITLVIPRIIAE